MNIKKNSYAVLALVFGVSVILYIFDVSTIPSSSQLVPTVAIPTAIPTLKQTMRVLSAKVIYTPKGRNENIIVSVRLNGTTISTLTSIHSMNVPKSRVYQNAFEAEIQSLVIGKDIKNLNLSKVAGASFTTDAFMQAIKKIQSNI